MKPAMYVTFSLGLIAVMTIPAYPAVLTAGAAESSVSSRPTSAEGVLKLALESEDPKCGEPYYNGQYCDPHWGED
jgi:hypothetical protein